MPDTQLDTTPRRFYCRHIFVDGHLCGSFSLRGEEFCYYHHTTRIPAHNGNDRRSRSRSATFVLPNPEDLSAIQYSIGEVLQRIAANEIDPRRAGLLLYGLQIASSNLPKEDPKAEPDEVVEEVVEDATFGTIALVTEVHGTKREPGVVEKLLVKLKTEFPDELADDPIRTIQAVAGKQANCRPNRRQRRRLRWLEEHRSLRERNPKEQKK
jgi:hypothetical protein